MYFNMNGINWKVQTIPWNSADLIDRTGVLTLATTDPLNHTIYLSDELAGDLKKRVVAHEMGHAACFSYGLISEIHNCCKRNRRIQMEEFICNFVADYGEEIFMHTYEIIGDDALYRMPSFFERMIA